jgi:hypothetical protein
MKYLKKNIVTFVFHFDIKITIFNYKELYGQIVLMNIHVKIYDPLKVNFLKISCSILKQ